MRSHISSSFTLVFILLKPFSFLCLSWTCSRHLRRTADTIMKVGLVVQPLLLLVLFSPQVNGIMPADEETTRHSATRKSPITPLDVECAQYEKCSQCIQSLGCLWCRDKKLSLDSRRCFTNDSHPPECKDTENPQGSVNEKKSETVANKVTSNDNIKIRPQLVELSLRKGQKINISIEYTDRKHRPLDLYIMMDLSCSMKKHKDKVANLTTTLAENLKNLTSNLRIGFGSFVDKPLPPFGFLGQPKTRLCENEAVESLPYGFKNHLKLTDDVEKFIEGVKTAGLSSNIDYPEGTLDGLLQSTVCTEIGWRTTKGNRRLIVVSTDGSFHLAGDGKLVGVVLPHDGSCYIDSSGMYTHATVLDYPSVSLVRQKIRENDVFVIFAVTKEQESNYNQLSEHLHPFAVTQRIDDDNSITSVIETEYKKLVNTVTLLSEYSHKDSIGIKFYAKCPGQSEFLNSNQCNGVGPEVTVSFKIEVQLKDCPSSPDSWLSNVTIYPQSSSEDYMTIKLSKLCGCDCEDQTSLRLQDGDINSTAECSNNGYLQCGICKCNSKWGGPFCNCSASDGGIIHQNECVDPETNLPCNNRGICDSCGKCKCHPVDGNPNAIGGKYCHCNNTNCPLHSSDKGLCNVAADDGPHGHCECSRCICEKGRFEGSRCECPTSTTMCLDPNGEICNEHGSCECGKCVCKSNYKGEHCEIQHAKVLTTLKSSCDHCFKSRDGFCLVASREEKCVECLVSTTQKGKTDGSRSEQCEEECKDISIEFKQRLGEQESNVCWGTKVDIKGCRFDYIIRGRNTIKNVTYLEVEFAETVLREKCPTPAPIFEIIVGIIGAMLFIGVILLLLWKTITHIKDRKEYERFETAIQQACWNTQENPLYKSTTSQFRNPAYLNYEESEPT